MPKSINRGCFLGFPNEPETYLFEEIRRARNPNRRQRKALIPTTESTWKCPQSGVRLAPGAVKNWGPIAKASD